MTPGIPTPSPRSSLRWAAVTGAAATLLMACTTTGTDPDAGVAAPASAPASATTATSAGAGPTARQTPSTAVSVPASPAVLPDVCALLSRAEVTALTGGRNIQAVDADPGSSTAVRYCGWQLSGARLGLQVSPTTPQRFRQDHPHEPAVAGLGDDAFWLSNHLFVRKDGLQLDVYASTNDGTAADRRLAEAAAAKVLPRL